MGESMKICTCKDIPLYMYTSTTNFTYGINLIAHESCEGGNVLVFSIYRGLR